MNAIKTAANLATEFANQLNNTPSDAQNWDVLSDSDDLPEFDYIALRTEFGDVTRHMERAYRRAFNAVFVTIRG